MMQNAHDDSRAADSADGLDEEGSRLGSRA